MINKINIPACFIAKSIPLAFDESLSYLEMVGALASTINTCIDKINETTELIETLDVSSINSRLASLESAMILANQRLGNIYLKSETYSRNEVNNRLTELENEINNELIELESDILSEVQELLKDAGGLIVVPENHYSTPFYIKDKKPGIYFFSYGTSSTTITNSVLVAYDENQETGYMLRTLNNILIIAKTNNLSDGECAITYVDYKGDINFVHYSSEYGLRGAGVRSLDLYHGLINTIGIGYAYDIGSKYVGDFREMHFINYTDTDLTLKYGDAEIEINPFNGDVKFIEFFNTPEITKVEVARYITRDLSKVGIVYLNKETTPYSLTKEETPISGGGGGGATRTLLYDGNVGTKINFDYNIDDYDVLELEYGITTNRTITYVPCVSGGAITLSLMLTARGNVTLSMYTRFYIIATTGLTQEYANRPNQRFDISASGVTTNENAAFDNIKITGIKY